MLTYMEADRMRILDLEAQIKDLYRSISALRAEKAQVQERLNAYRYPVLTLANEITSEIFIQFLPPYPVPPPPKGRASPTSLTRVCHKWREVALATPALWRAIDFGSWIVPYAQCRHIFNTWIERSKSCLLSIVIDHFAPDLLPSVFTEPVALTIEHLKVRRVLIPSFLRSTRMPFLRSLDISSYSNKDVFTFHDVPRLRTVVLHGRFIPLVRLPWIQLTCLTLNEVGVNQCVQILAESLNLVKCVLFLDGSPLDGPAVKLALPCLESLTLKTVFSAQTAMGNFFQSFDVPSLHRLELQEAFLDEDPLLQLKSFISKSGCTLEQVCITGGITTSPKSYRRVFPSIPTFSFPGVSESTDDKSEDDFDDDGSEDNTDGHESEDDTGF